MKRRYASLVNDDERKEYLKALGCVAWIKPGEMVEQMTGAPITPTGKGSFDWDGALNRFVGTIPRSSGYAASIATGLSVAETFAANSYSYIYRNARKISGSGYYTSIATASPTSSSNVPVIVFDGTTNVSSWPESEFNSCVIAPNGGNRQFYPTNGGWLEGAEHRPYSPSNWEKPLLTLYIAKYNNNSTAISASFGEFFLFNRGITREDVHDIVPEIPAN